MHRVGWQLETVRSKHERCSYEVGCMYHINSMFSYLVRAGAEGNTQDTCVRVIIYRTWYI